MRIRIDREPGGWTVTALDSETAKTWRDLFGEITLPLPLTHEADFVDAAASAMGLGAHVVEVGRTAKWAEYRKR